ncbi:phage integrase SAM-like domain-containing protein [uncultured Pontibacter sp.]|uniref:tyrosine-type recombinase/integrase n=1 Tax=uncultured Pontibacter sp. TaxID=453356 RepID=UPI00262EC972|nr:phage integrase SAM-like domain-containing protein [uncultured Pontibacter sp.]
MSKNEVATLFATLNMAKSDTATPYKLARLIIPQTDKGRPDLNARWSITFWVWDDDKQKKVRIVRDWDINQYATVAERKQRASVIINEINKKLKKGHVISKAEKKQVKFTPKITKDTLTLKDAIDNYIAENRSSLSPNTIAGYVTLKNTLFPWLDDQGLSDIKLIDFDGEAAKAFFNYLKLEKVVIRKGVEEIGVSNKTFNNYHTNLNRIYNALIADGTIKKKNNHIQKISKKKKVHTNKHVPFSNEQLKLIKKCILEKGDEQLYLFINFLYYTAARPARELRLLQVKDILDETIFIPADRSKVGVGRHAFIPPALEKLIKKHKLRSYPPDYYVFTREGKPGPEHVGKVYFYLRHREVLEELGMTDQEYTLYGYKHTGNINLYQATKDLIAIKEQNGHTSLDQTYNYMVKLGQIRKGEIYRQFPEFGK